jgi:DNA-binding CsgD family transcriptional regulator
MSAATARLVSNIGKPAFSETLLSAAGQAIAHDAAALMVLHHAAPPTVLIDRLKPAERGYLYGDYLSGVYSLSPFYRAARKLKAPLTARIMDIAPKGFTQSEYYRRYFALIGVDDMIGMLIPAGNGDTVFMSFSRSSGRPRFTAPELRALDAQSHILAAATARHVELAGPIAARKPEPASKPETPPANGLTLRESQVVNLILEGHSSRAVAEALKISNETVRVHRRNIYEKLGVSSQAELFRWFLSTRT